jgi:hypothetical protein
MSCGVVPLRSRHSRSARLMTRFGKLPKRLQDLIRDDMETAFEGRILVMERIVKHGLQ